MATATLSEIDRVVLPLDEDHALELARSADLASCRCRTSPTGALAPCLHLVVLKGGAPWVCRRATTDDVESLLYGDVDSLFEGRLRLRRERGGIRVDVKGQPIRTLPLSDLRTALQRVQQRPERRAHSRRGRAVEAHARVIPIV